MAYTFHLLGLAHVPTIKTISACAYTQKIINLAKMLTSMGHKVITYCTEGSEIPNVEMVIVSDEATRRKTYGDYDWKSEFFRHDKGDEAHKVFNTNAVRAINVRKSERDFLLCPMGNYDQVIADAVNLMTVEPGIGYTGIFCDKRVYESYAWMHYLYGLSKVQDGQWYDAVIPNSYDMIDFPYTYATPNDKSDYYLFVGRLIQRKGLRIAIDATEQIGAKLVVAGQGNLSNVEGEDLSGFDHVTHIGTIGSEERFELMRHARAIFVPTSYVGPFEGVAVEAQLCGTPAITTDWGVFQETVLNGVTGFRCRTFREFVNAAMNWNAIDPNACRNWSVQRYSIDVVKHQYQVYFDRLYDLWDQGWYQLNPINK